MKPGRKDSFLVTLMIININESLQSPPKIQFWDQRSLLRIKAGEEPHAQNAPCSTKHEMNCSAICQWLLCPARLSGNEFTLASVLNPAFLLKAREGCFVASLLRNENGGDNTLMFCFLLSSAYQKSRIFFFLVSCCACEKQKKLGGSMDGMDDPKWPKGRSTPQDIPPSK